MESGTAGEQKAIRSLAQASILVVEDMEINQQLIVGMLTHLGHKVEVASDGIEGLEWIGRHTAGQCRFDLVLMNVQMPLMDGLAATRAIRALKGSAADLPVVALTANAYLSNLKACREAGMNDHLAKPFTMPDLARMVARWAGRTDVREDGRAIGDATLVRLHPKFTIHCEEAAKRLAELNVELASCPKNELAALRIETQKIAHKLAGTAAMFGQPGLGKAAGEIDQTLAKPAIRSDSPGARTRLIADVACLAGALKKAA